MSEIPEPNIIECDPDKLFLEIFTNYPKDYCTQKIISRDIELEETFEILLDLYGEALANVNILLYFLDKLDDPHGDFKIDYCDVKDSDLLIPEVWFKSFGYSITITEINEEIIDQINPYCSIMFKDNPLDTGFFYMRNMDNKYHFVKKKNYQTKNDIKNIKALLTIPTKNYNTKTYSIGFIDLSLGLNRHNSIDVYHD